jgi:hypothetical protein
LRAVAIVFATEWQELLELERSYQAAPALPGSEATVERIPFTVPTGAEAMRGSTDAYGSSALGPASVTARLTDPSGAEVIPWREREIEWAIASPAPGEWTIEVFYQGTAGLPGDFLVYAHADADVSVLPVGPSEASPM